MMFSELFSTRDLIVVFKLCDPSGTGRVNVNHLKELAKFYAENDTQVFFFVFNFFLLVNILYLI